MQRIVSFLPSATEMVCALGLSDALVGITHECDYPPEVKSKPVVVRNVLPIETMNQSEIDRAVAQRLRDGQSLYQIDEGLLRELAPDLILTQNLCQVCAPSGNEVSQVLKALPHTPQILWLTPQSLGEIFENLRELGAATGRLVEAEGLINNCRARLDKLATASSKLSDRPRVFCMTADPCGKQSNEPGLRLQGQDSLLIQCGVKFDDGCRKGLVLDDTRTEEGQGTVVAT